MKPMKDEMLPRDRMPFATVSRSWPPATVVVAALLMCGICLRAQEIGRSPTQFTGQVRVDVVTVDVVVTDRKGRPVTDLDTSDFRVLEDGVEMDITNFLAVQEASHAPDAEGPRKTQVRVAPSSVVPVEVSRASRERYLAIYVDHMFIRTQSLRRLAPLLQRFVREEVPEGTHMMLAGYDGSVKIRVPFTDDVQQIVRALEDEARHAGGANMADATEFLGLEAWAWAESVALDAAGGSGEAAAEALAMVEEERQAALDALAENYQATIRRSWSHLQFFVDSFAALPGRKVIVHVSDGVSYRPDYWNSPASSSIGRSAATPNWASLSRALAAVISHASTLGVTIHSVYGEAGSRGVSSGSAIHPSVSGRVAAGRSDLLRQQQFNMEANALATIQMMSLGTGGLTVIKPTVETMAPLGTDVRSYYSIGYRPPSPGDGKAHKIEVEVARKKVRIRHRSDYVALSERDRVAAQALASLAMPDAENSLHIAWQVPTPGQPTGDLFRVPLYVQVPSDRLALLPDGESWRGSVRLFAVASDLEGGLAPVFEKSVPINVNQPVYGESRLTFNLQARIDLAPGQHTVAVTVFDELAGIASTEVGEMVVDSSGGVWRVIERDR
jgi:VWFA-related protein